MLAIKLADPAYVSPDHFAQLLTSTGQGMPELGVIVTLGNGFIITAMIWAGFLAALIDRRTGVAIATLVTGGVLTLFGVIHSVEPGGGLYLPWALSGVGRTLALQFSAGYLTLAAVIALLGLQRPSETAG